MSSMVVHRPNSSGPSSSFTPPTSWRYEFDVFLSFRGEDTRDNFVDHLHKELCLKGIHTFMDDKKLQTGEEIGPELLKAIEQSRFSIVVFSKDYASSRWCLNELVKILECKETSGTIVYPVFYHVDPSDIRKQTGDFGKGLEDLVSKYDTIDMDQVQLWRDALEKVANLKGWPYPSATIIRSETKFIEELVQDISIKLDSTYSRVTESLVGMPSRVEKVVELLGLGLDEARVVGIWGMGGIGKTTIARAVCDHISWQFKGCSFLENVRENSKRYRGVETLQEKLISEVLMEDDLKVRNIYNGITMINKRISGKEVLIVLDDVDSSVELENIFGELLWSQFHRKSRIIVTTRDLHILTANGVRHIYKVEELAKEEAVELLTLKACVKHQLMRDFEKVIDHAVEYAKGVPLALKVLGSFLKGRSKGEWESELRRLKESPDEEVERILKISYGALDRDDKKIFLDIACFFKGKHVDDVSKILDSCGFNPGIGIKVLIEKSLITISKYNELLMHDLIQKLGWHIVREECPHEPGERSRLWLHEDMTHVLEDNMGTNKVEGIFVDYPEPEGGDLEQLKLSTEAFEKMRNLRILKICSSYISEDCKYLSNKLRYLDWCGYPSKHLPSTFQPKYLVEIHLTYSSIKQLWKGAMPLDKLLIMNLSHSTYLSKCPDFSKVPNLERLILEGCTSFVQLHPSIGNLRRLTCLNLRDCKNFKSLPIGIQLESLEILIVSGCSKLKIYLETFEYMKHLSELYLDGTSLKELPPSVVHLTNLRSLNLSDCKNLRSIPNDIGQLKALTKLILSGCSKLHKLPEEVGFLDRLTELRVDRTAIRQFPSSIVLPEKLQILSLRGCGKTTSNSGLSILWNSFLRRPRENALSVDLPDLSRFKYLKDLNISYCNIKSIPVDICSLHSLERLDLSGNDFESLPACMNQLKLSDIWLWGCYKLQELPELSSEIGRIWAGDCVSLRTILNPSIYRNVTSFNFRNCVNLVENGQTNFRLEEFFANRLQGGRQTRFQIFFPVTEISDWFIHRSIGASVSFRLPPNWCNSRLLGFVFSVAVELKDLKTKKTTCIDISVHIGDHKLNSFATGICFYRSSVVWIEYVRFSSRFLVDLGLEHFNDSVIDITFSFYERATGNAIFKECGARVIYEKDDDDDGNDQASNVEYTAPNDRSIGEDDNTADSVVESQEASGIARAPRFTLKKVESIHLVV